MMTPAFALNFQTAVFDTRVTFTRTGATATRVNSSGVIESVAADTPRFDYDPITKACKGLLVEGEAINYAVQSKDSVQNTALVGVTTNVTAITAPDGTMTGNKISVANGVEVPLLFTINQYAMKSATIAGADPIAFSIFAKKAEFDRITLSVARSNDLSLSRNYVSVDLNTGTVVENSAGASQIKVTPFDDGWYRIGFVSPKTADNMRVGFSVSNSTATTGNGTDGIYVWQWQHERSASVSSPIFTTTAAVTRNADVATITGTNFSSFWRATRGGVLVRARPSTVSGTHPWVQFDDNTADNIIALRGNTTNPELYIKATTDQAQIDAGTIAANTSYRLAGTWATNDCAASINSGTPVLDTSATIPAVTQMRIGSDGTNYLNGHIESIEYYDQRILNSSMQVVSSPAGYRSIIGPVMRDTIIR
jgi:hypothetical protein